jgi:hypothetical protein
MNTLKRIFGIVLPMALLGFFASCGDDDLKIDVGDGLNVADGFYITQADVDPVPSSRLATESVEDGFDSKAREGFRANYVYLTTGNYNIVNVVNRQITATYGGAAETIEEDGGCSNTSYQLVESTLNGAPFNVAQAGLYKVTYDNLTGEVVLFRIVTAGLIGDATAGGWGADQIIEGTVTAEGGTWEMAGVVLRSGSFKLRFNCRWAINRGEYILFTNFSGPINNLQTGNDGPNIPVGASETLTTGTYTIRVTWSPTQGFRKTATRTGDAPVLSFDPLEHPFGIRGTAAIDWAESVFFKYLGKEGDTYRWAGLVQLGEGEFKVSDGGGKWFGHGLVTNNTDGAFSGDDNFVVSAAKAGFYYFTVETSDDGETYTSTVTEGSFGIIGSATPAGWDNSTAMEPTATGFTIDTQLGVGEMKFRANSAWAINYGGSISELAFNGGNIQVSAAGNYRITLTTEDKGENWSATMSEL